MESPAKNTQEYRSTKLMVGIPGKMHKWTHFGAGTEGTGPKEGLAIWKTLRLDHKLPYLTIPPGEQPLSRGQTGNKLWTQRRAHDLRLYDSCGHAMNIPYDSLHDPYLLSHHHRKPAMTFLQKTGQVHTDGAAICDIRQINHYREVKRMMNLDYVHYAINVEEEALQEERRLQRIEESLKKSSEKRSMREIKEHIERQKEIFAKVEADKKKKWELSTKRKHIYLDQMQQRKMREQMLKALQNMMKANKVKLAHNEIEELKRRRTLRMIGQIRQREHKTRRFLVHKARHQKKLSIEQVKTNWEMKKAKMLKEHSRTETVLRDVVAERQANIARRKATALETKQIQDDFRKEQIRQKYLKKEEMNRKNHEARIKKAVIDSLIKEMDIDEEKLSYLVDETLKRVFTKEFSYEGPDNYLAIMACQENIRKNKDIPLHILERSEPFVNKTNEEYVQKVLKQMLVSAKAHVVEYGSKLLNDLRERRRRQPTQSTRLAELTIKRGEKVSENISHKRTLVNRSFTAEHLELTENMENDAESTKLGEHTDSDIEEKSDRESDFGELNSLNYSKSSPIVIEELQDSSAYLNENEISHSSANVTRLPRLVFSDKKINNVSEVQPTRANSDLSEAAVATQTMNLSFSHVEEISIPKAVIPIRCRQKTPMPSLAHLTRIAMNDDAVPDLMHRCELDDEKTEATQLNKTCRREMAKVLKKAETLVAASIEPTTRQSAIKELTPFQDDTMALVTILTNQILRDEFKPALYNRKLRGLKGTDAAAGGVAKHAASKLLRPPELRLRENPGVMRYRIMVGKPPQPLPPLPAHYKPNPYVHI